MQLVAQSELHQGCPTGVGQDLAQQGIALDCCRQRLQVVGQLVADGVDLGLIDELDDFDGRLFVLQCPQFIGVDDDQLALVVDALDDVGEGYGFTDAACGDAEGNFYFSDLGKSLLYRVGANETKPTVWLEGGPKISGLKFGPDGKMYACVQGTGTNNVKRIIVIDPATKQIETVATDVQPNDLIVSKGGWIYFTDTGAGEVVGLPTSARNLNRPHPVAGGINKPNGIGLTPDQRQLVVSEYGGTNAWTFLIADNGSLRGGEKNMELRAQVGKTDSGGDGLTTDAQGRAWITSNLGIQMFDANGRMGGIVSRPQEKGTVSCAFAGPGRSYLYVCSSDKVYRRKTLVEGAKVP